MPEDGAAATGEKNHHVYKPSPSAKFLVSEYDRADNLSKDSPDRQYTASPVLVEECSLSHSIEMSKADSTPQSPTSNSKTKRRLECLRKVLSSSSESLSSEGPILSGRRKTRSESKKQRQQPRISRAVQTDSYDNAGDVIEIVEIE